MFNCMQINLSSVANRNDRAPTNRIEPLARGANKSFSRYRDADSAQFFSLMTPGPYLVPVSRRIE